MLNYMLIYKILIFPLRKLRLLTLHYIFSISNVTHIIPELLIFCKKEPGQSANVRTGYINILNTNEHIF